jgi:hypothetical protein
VDQATLDQLKAYLLVNDSSSTAFAPNFYALIGNKSTTDITQNQGYPGYSSSPMLSTPTSSTLVVKSVIRTMYVMAQEGGDNSTPSTAPPPLPAVDPNDKVVNNFSQFILRATIDVLKQAATKEYAVATATKLGGLLNTLQENALSNPNLLITNKYLNSGSQDNYWMSFIGYHAPASNNGIFQLYNTLITLNAVRSSNNVSTNGSINNVNAPSFVRTYTKRMAMAIQYVIQYYFYLMLLYTLLNATDISTVGYPLPTGSPPGTANTALQQDCWTVLCRLANLEALLDKDATTIANLASNVRSFEDLGPDATNVDTAQRAFDANKRKLATIQDKSDTNKQALETTRFTMIQWILGLIIYIGIFVALFNFDIPNVELDKKAMGIIIVNGLVATVILVSEIIAAYYQRNA